jgi:hypothetical protein
MFNADEVTTVVDLASLQRLKHEIVSLFLPRFKSGDPTSVAYVTTGKSEGAKLKEVPQGSENEIDGGQILDVGKVLPLKHTDEILFRLDGAEPEARNLLTKCRVYDA